MRFSKFRSRGGNHSMQYLVQLLVVWLALGAGSMAAWAAHPVFDGVRPPAEATVAETGNADRVGPRDYVLFESGPVRPVVMSVERQQLYVANIPDGKLEIFAVTDVGLVHWHSVPVGLEPVAVEIAPDGDVWVVNHLSDSVSIVDVQARQPHVRQTLWVGDEPRDIVFGGAQHQRAFITTAHRGQNSPIEPQSTVPGIGRADVWVFDSADPGDGTGGEPLTVVSLFGDTPRALAVSPDGGSVYAAVFHSGNRTTTLAPANFPKPGPSTSADGVPQPDTGLIVQFNGVFWADETGRDWSSRVGFSLPDQDVFVIDANANPPQRQRSIAGVGTTLFNMAVNPVNGDVYVSNTEARNQVRFAGMANRANTTVRGHLADNRITVIRGEQVMPRRLNKHLDFNRTFGTQAERDTSLSTPLDMVVSADGEQLYVAAFGSSKIGIFDTAQLADNSFAPDADNHIELSGGGPAGMVLDEQRDRLYVLTRFDNTVSVVDLDNQTETQHLALLNPEPQRIIDGRPFMYDARLTSSRGNDSCATCHVFGNLDALAWDLGDPDGVTLPIPNGYHPVTATNPGLTFTFHPMKGPMTTQSMRGLKRHGPMHWRGDRTGIERAEDETREEAAFKEFNEAFESLMAREGQLSDEQMQVFTDFALELTYPPNPHRNLDNSLNVDQSFGQRMFLDGFARPNRPVEPCAACHTLDPALGLFGTSGLMSFNDQPGEKDFKIPHFRDQYQKVGMFTPSVVNPFISGPQIRGFGYNHNGATSSSAILAEFFLPEDRFRQIREYLLAFPTESPPILGQQVSVSMDNADNTRARMELLLARASVTEPLPECDLVVQTTDGGSQSAWLYDRQSERFNADDSSRDELTANAMMLRASGSEQSYQWTCVPWGSGQRVALDRDGDGLLNGDERRQGSDPDNAQSTAFHPQVGIWWNPERSGHGMDIQRAGNLLGVTWFTYLENGRGVWYRALAPLSSDWTAPLIIFHWNAQEQRTTSTEVGTLSLDFESASRVVMNWTIGQRSGTETFVPFVFAPGLPAPDFTGIWHTPESPGFGVSIASNGQRRFVVATVYNDAGEPVWMIGNGSNSLNATFPLNRWRGACPHCEFEPVTSTVAGEITLRFDGMRSGRVDLQLTSADGGVWQRQDALLAPISAPPN